MTDKFYVYILRSKKDQHLYVGCTSDLTRRLKEHNDGLNISTKARIPFELLTYIVFNSKQKAFSFEEYLKTGSGKAFLNKRLI